NRRLRGSSLTDGEEGYAGLIDVDAAIDHHLLNVLAFNVDALRLSGYFHKPRGGKLTFGPIWDFDRALGSTDGRDRNPRTWRSTSGDRGTDFFNYPWWRDMFRDLDFFQRYIDRYQTFRRSEFSNRNINAIIDSMADELREAQKRNLSRWNQRPRGSNGGTYQGEIDYMKDWLEDRMEFMDGEFVDAPLLGVSSLGESKVVSLSSRDGGVIYYTTDGTDPRLPGGNPSGKASIYKSTIEFSTSTTITARVFNENHRSRTGSNNPPLSSKWSGPSTRLISLSVPPRAGELIVSEIHYNPQSANNEELLLSPSFRNEDFEFIELKNIGNTTLELAGTEFSNGIQFRFPFTESWALPAGRYITVAKNLDAFNTRYPAYDGYLAGPFNGNLSNGGETLSIQNSAGSTLTEFRYEDNWYPTTDGDGFSLVVANEDGSGADYATQEAWRQGSVLHGTPGTKDAGQISVSLESIQIVDGSVSIAFQSEAGITYIMEYTTALAGADWQTLRLIPASAESALISVTDQNPQDQTRFYRLNVVTE
ncbi:CotH kinase family protein, partial [Verrucomicrobia bacterium]|nr:CotH kinase family protein [Verrucomicrobiota bacterium]